MRTLPEEKSEEETVVEVPVVEETQVVTETPAVEEPVVAETFVEAAPEDKFKSVSSLFNEE